MGYTFGWSASTGYFQTRSQMVAHLHSLHKPAPPITGDSTFAPPYDVGRCDDARVRSSPMLISVGRSVVALLQTGDRNRARERKEKEAEGEWHPIIFYRLLCGCRIQTDYAAWRKCGWALVNYTHPPHANARVLTTGNKIALLKTLRESRGLPPTIRIEINCGRRLLIRSIPSWGIRMRRQFGAGVMILSYGFLSGNTLPILRRISQIPMFGARFSIDRFWTYIRSKFARLGRELENGVSGFLATRP